MRSSNSQPLSSLILTAFLVLGLGGCFPNPKDLDQKSDVDPIDTQNTDNDGTSSLNDTETPLDTVLVQDLKDDDSAPADSDDIADEDTADIAAQDIQTQDSIDDTVDVVAPTDVSSEPDVADTTVTPPRCPGGSIVFTWGTNSNQRIEVTEPISVSDKFGPEIRSRTYECPDSFFNVVGFEPLWEAPISVSWLQPLGTSSQWRDFSVAFNTATLWDYLTQNGQAETDLTRVPSGTLTVTSSTGDTRELALKFIRPALLKSFPDDTPPHEGLAFEANESPSHGFTFEVEDEDRGYPIDHFALRVEPSTYFSPEIQYPDQWGNNSFSPAAGQLRITNRCATAGERAYFGHRSLWLWYASGTIEKKTISLIFKDTSGSELKRFIIYDMRPTAYEPQYDACGSSSQQEVIMFDFDWIERS